MNQAVHTFFPIEEPFEILSETADGSSILFEIRILSSTAGCPACGKRTHSKHSWYTRKIKDLPLGERAVSFYVHLHKWFCINPACATCIFTERLSWVSPHHQMTKRLEEALLQFSLEMNCLAAEKVCDALHIPVSHDTLLRLLKQKELPLSDPSPFCRH
ncbi:transposase family protein [Domibacillus sp. A3M-37]|jgi:transposase|uniref:transposase family protein n=1 Tax=Domibacillus sp. A3M-37 TaxID=2962037 RepID=UPI0020B81724|nr:transposase family protein [Domibacillus sp. A3M-37]MCP3764539.1 transposase family protein [Domibacillus sp. A3M-37]